MLRNIVTKSMLAALLAGSSHVATAVRPALSESRTTPKQPPGFMKKAPKQKSNNVCYQMTQAIPTYPTIADGKTPSWVLDNSKFEERREAEGDMGLKLREKESVKSVVNTFFRAIFQAVVTAAEEAQSHVTFRTALLAYVMEYATVSEDMVQSMVQEAPNATTIANLIIFAWFNVPLNKQCEVRGNEISDLWNVGELDNIDDKVLRGSEIRAHLENHRDIRHVFGHFYVIMSKTMAVKAFVQLLGRSYPALEKHFPNLFHYTNWKKDWGVDQDSLYLALVGPSNWAGMNFSPHDTAGCRFQTTNGWRNARAWQNPTEPEHTWTKEPEQFVTAYPSKVIQALSKEASAKSEVHKWCEKFYGKRKNVDLETYKDRSQGGAYSYKLDWSVWQVGNAEGKDVSMPSPSYVVRLAGAPETAGPSGTMSDMMMVRMMLGSPKPEDIKALRSTGIALLVPMRDHSMVEVLLGAEPFVAETDRVFMDCPQGLTLKGSACEPPTEARASVFHEQMLRAIDAF